MRPALTANSGSRGKIQVRCCHGRIASSCSHRQTVLSLMRATMPDRCASRTISAVLSRESGRPSVAGSSHASALILTTSSGGKSPGPTRAWAFLQARHAFLEESLAPQTDDIASDGERRRDLVIGVALRGQQDHSGPNHLKIWQRILADPTLQDGSLARRQDYAVRAVARHSIRPPRASRSIALAR